jgi:hypothetical protein
MVSDWWASLLFRFRLGSLLFQICQFKCLGSFNTISVFLQVCEAAEGR